MQWLVCPRPSGQHALVVIKMATKEDAEKLLKSDSVKSEAGSSCHHLRSCTPVACLKRSRL